MSGSKHSACEKREVASEEDRYLITVYSTKSAAKVTRSRSTSSYLQTILRLQADKRRIKLLYYIDTDEIPGFFLLLKNHIFIVRSEDTIFIFHV